MHVNGEHRQPGWREAAPHAHQFVSQPPVSFPSTLRNGSLVKNVEASGKHMVFYTDAEIQDQLVYTLSLVREEPV